MSCPVIERDVLDKVKIVVDFATWFGSSGAAISAAAWVVPTNVTESDDGNTTTTAFNYLEFSAAGEYEIACTITTNESPTRKKTQRFQISVQDSC